MFSLNSLKNTKLNYIIHWAAKWNKCKHNSVWDMLRRLTDAKQQSQSNTDYNIKKKLISEVINLQLFQILKA